MGRIEELASIKDKIKGELSSFQVGYLEELADELSDYAHKYWDNDSEDNNDLSDYAGTLGSLIEDVVACFEDVHTAVKDLEALLSSSKLKYDKHSN